jgi:hypothetical protein
MKPFIFLAAIATLSLPHLGCAIEAVETDVISQRTIVDNDSVLNGVRMNGVRMNGVRMNGVRMNGVRMNGVALNSSILEGTREDTGQPMIGSDFVGTDMDVELADATLSTVRVQSVQQISGIDYYEVEYWDGSQWQNICDANTLSIPVNGKWDADTGDFIADSTVFTYACQGAALAKCVEWGYEIWGTHQECDGATCQERSLADFHQACTRMVRGDYCGDGVAHTENGTTIDVWDALGILTETTGSGLDLEAEWTTDGAACVMHTRWVESAGTEDEDYILANCPERWAGPENPTPPASCGTSGSDFFTANGFSVPTSQRRILRNASGVNVR